MQAKRTQINVKYQGRDITADIAPFLLSFTFSDNSGSKADDISLSLEDRAGLWLNNWTPSKGDTITASITHYDGDNASSFPCGTFSIDQIDYSYPPAVMNIKAVSSSVKKAATSQKHSRVWENVSLSEICADIAGDNSLSLFMDVHNEYRLGRADQIQQSDLDFLRGLCADYGLTVKIQESRLIIYDTESYEDSEPVTEIAIDDGRLTGFKFTSKSTGTYRKARVHYHDALKDEDYDAEYTDDSEEGSERVLEVYERAESQADAERIAENRLINANRNEITGSLSLTGDTRLCAGVTVKLTGFGTFRGKYFVKKCTHKADRSGYTCTLELGMPEAEKVRAKSRKKAVQSRQGRNSGEVFWEDVQ